MGMFKVGDMVRVRKDLNSNNIYGGVNFVSEMLEYRGKVFKIESKLGHLDNVYYLKDGRRWTWSDEMLEKVKLKKITFEKYKKGEEYV